MKSLYVTSVERYSGKTATCLALGKRFQADGYKVGYAKPLSLLPWHKGNKPADEDAAFVKEILGLAAEPWELSPVVVTPEMLHAHLRGESETNLMSRVEAAVETAGAGQDVLLLEGGGSLREGYVMGLPTPVVAARFGSVALAVVKYRDDVRVLDDTLTAKSRLGDILVGVILNRVPGDAQDFVADLAVPFLEKQGISVLGVMPEARSEAALTVGELIDLLDADVLSETRETEGVVQHLSVGAEPTEAALKRFRRQTDKAVIAPGDQTNILSAALETSTTCLILTDNLLPDPVIVNQADDHGITVLLVCTSVRETVEQIEGVFGQTHLGQAAKLQQFEELLAEHVDLERLYAALDLKQR